MANLAGFIPQPGPGAVYGGNWSQDYGDVMNTLVEAQRAQQQNQFAHSPFGGSFNRRFGGAMPAGLSGAMPQQQEAMPDLAALQGALAQAMQGAPGTNMMEGLAPGGGDLAQHSGAMQQQPWYDEYLAAHEGGAQLPMLQNMGGRGLNEVEQAGIQDRRQQRLGGTLPMADRRANVRNNAIAESEQRSVRMGDMSQNQQYFNELSRLQGQLGGQQGGGDLMNGVMFGPQAMADMAMVGQRDRETQAKLAFAASPQGMMAASVANGTPMSMQQIQQMLSGVPLPEQLLEQSGGDWERFKTMANANGLSAEETLQAWSRMTGQHKGGVQTPSIFDQLSGAGSSAGWDWNPYD
jgi:hypothetical protein